MYIFVYFTYVDCHTILSMKVISPGITKAELADIYGVNVRLFNGWLEEMGFPPRKKRFTPKQLFHIVKELYLPKDATLNIKEPHFEVREQTDLFQ